MSLLFRRRAIQELAAGELPAAEATRLRAHLAGCAVCRGYYDGLALVAAAAGTAGGAEARARERLRAALATPAASAPATTAAGARAPLPRPRGVGFRLALLAAPALAGVTLLAVRVMRPTSPATPPLEPDIAWRGTGQGVPRDAAPPHAAPPPLDPEAMRAGLVLRVYASRPAPDGRPGPVRLVGELPGSGELRVAAGDYVQLAHAGLRQQRYLAVFAADEAGRLQPFWPRPASPSATLPPGPEPRPLGRSLDLGALGLAGRARLLAVVSAEPISAAFGVAAAQRALTQAAEPALPVVVLDGVLKIEPSVPR